MTVQELIDELECCAGDAEVRFLAQPSWPFEYAIAAVVEATFRPKRRRCVNEWVDGRAVSIVAASTAPAILGTP